MKLRRALCLFVFVLVLLAACAPAPTATPMPTATTPATSTPQLVAITATATSWLVTATSAPTATPSPTPANTATLTAVPGEFKNATWSGGTYSDVNNGEILSRAGAEGRYAYDSEYVQGNNTIKIAITGDVTSDPRWQQYYNANFYPGSAPSFKYIQALADGGTYGRSMVAGFLRYDDTHTNNFLSSQLSNIAANLLFSDHLDKVYVTIGLADGQVQVTQVRDDTTRIVYSVDESGAIGEAVATATPIVSESEINTGNILFADNFDSGIGPWTYM